MTDTTAPPLEVTASPQQPLGMTPATFLQQYWQKRPLLIRNAFADFQPPLTPDDLGGLGCEAEALSRLVEYDREQDAWTLHTGPLDEALFQRLPDRDWTLLVQDVDKWDADVAGLLASFRFLPGWRIDDVMVSYAEAGGGVGAHVDHYDVFLLQGMGQRRWRIDTQPDPPTDFRDDVPLKQLRRFTPDHDWTLEPGDMLYLPPGVPHDGTAVDPCMTFSVGMRAPARSELLLDFTEYVAESMPEAARYTDPDLTPVTDDGEIDAAALTRVADQLGPAAGLADRARLADWFGRFITTYRSAQFAAAPANAIDTTQLAATLAAGAQLLQHPFTRLAWVRGDDATRVALYAAGEPVICTPALAQQLCRGNPLTLDSLPPPPDADALLQLINAGHLILDSDA